MTGWICPGVGTLAIGFIAISTAMERELSAALASDDVLRAAPS